MNAEQYTFAAAITFMIALCSAVFLGWVVWSLFFDIYDHLMQQRTRKRNSQFQPRVGSCYRDERGLTK
jgi:hypothetical protein